MRKAMYVGALALGLGVCAFAEDAAQPVSPADAAGDTGTVVFFREKKMMGAAIRYKVRENGVELCKLSNGRYCMLKVAPGKHEYLVHTEAKDALTLDVAAGQTYYVQGGISMGAFAGHPHLESVDPAVYEGMKAKLKDNTGKDLGGPDDEDKK